MFKENIDFFDKLLQKDNNGHILTILFKNYAIGKTIYTQDHKTLQTKSRHDTQNTLEHASTCTDEEGIRTWQFQKIK